jgi:hypothetical protein
MLESFDCEVVLSDWTHKWAGISRPSLAQMAATRAIVCSKISQNIEQPWETMPSWDK